MDTVQARQLIKSFPFPTTTEAFIAYQEKATGRALAAWEKDFSIEMAEMINLAFVEGKTGCKRFNIRDRVEDFFSGNGHTDLLQEPGTQHILEMMDAWSRIAYQVGKESSKYG